MSKIRRMFSIRNINRRINWVIGLMKWPMAILMLFAIVPAFQTDFILIRDETTQKIFMEFFLPFIATVVFFLIMPGLSGSFLTITEHELTHMLFAVLTLHKPKELEVNQDRGGSFSFIGEGNWLIALAPYFFPTFTFVLMIGVSIYEAIYHKLPDFHLILFGIFIGYHFIVTLFEIHPKQTDFIVAGPIFTICFLPGINLLMYGALFAYILRGWEGIPMYGRFVIHSATKIIQNLF